MAKNLGNIVLIGIWQGPKKVCKVVENTICRNVKPGFYCIYKILGMNRSFRRHKQQKEDNIKTQTNSQGVTQFKWHKEGEKYAAVNTAINGPSTSTQG